MMATAPNAQHEAHLVALFHLRGQQAHERVRLSVPSIEIAKACQCSALPDNDFEESRHWLASPSQMSGQLTSRSWTVTCSMVSSVRSEYVVPAQWSQSDQVGRQIGGLSEVVSNVCVMLWPER